MVSIYPTNHISVSNMLFYLSKYQTFLYCKTFIYNNLKKIEMNWFQYIFCIIKTNKI
jgi:hypothetical protein